jgi:hypothetical protein
VAPDEEARHRGLSAAFTTGTSVVSSPKPACPRAATGGPSSRRNLLSISLFGRSPIL